MRPVKVLTGSIATITPKLAAEFDIGIVPYHVTYAGRTHSDGIDLNYADFIRFLRGGEGFPTTSHPSLSDFTRAFSAAAESARTIVYISIAPVYSKGYTMAKKAAEELTDLDIEVIDCAGGAGGQTMIALEAARVANEGTSKEGVLATIAGVKMRTDVALTLETMRYLAHGGRIHRAQAVLGSLFTLKPVIAYRDKMTTAIARPHTHAQALSFLKDLMKSEYVRFDGRSIRCIVEDVDNEEWADRAEEMVRGEFPIDELWRIPTSATIAAHVGPGAWGITWYIVP